MQIKYHAHICAVVFIQKAKVNYNVLYFVRVIACIRKCVVMS